MISLTSKILITLPPNLHYIIKQLFIYDHTYTITISISTNIPKFITLRLYNSSFFTYT